MNNTLADTNGRSWAHKNTLKAGDKVTWDSGFDCLPKSSTISREVKIGSNGLYIDCEEGRHYLAGQLNAKGAFVGIYPA